MNNNTIGKHEHKKIKICVAGASETGHCGVDALDKAKDLGKLIAESGCVLLVEAATGFPLWVAMGAKEANGMVIGFSPAASELEHAERYKLPLDYMDLIIYTGFGYAGRDLLLIRSADAVICGCGRIGTIGEFTIAFKDGKPLGIFEGPWETGAQLEDIVTKSHIENKRIIVNDDPKKLLSKIIELVNTQKIIDK